MFAGLAIGLAFGFALQRGSFCGATMLSSVVLYRDTKGIAAILAAILVSMLGFALMAHQGWIIPNPNPLRLLSAVVGGVAFGAGMVLAGGCITGCLYKAGEGRLTQMLAIVSTGIGAIVVGGGALQGARKALVVATRDLEWSASLDEATGLSYELLGSIIAAVGIVALLVVYFTRRKSKKPSLSLGGKKLVTGGWSPVTSGVAVGILGWLAYLSSSEAGRNNALGGLGGVRGAFSLLVSGEYSGSIWMIWLVAGIVLGSAVSARMRGELKLRSADAATLLVALLGGFLLGAGAALGRGCFIGNTITGLALLSVHSLVFTLCMVAANLVTTTLYLRGLR